MKALVEFSLIPIGVDVSLSKYIVACEHVLRNTGLTVELHANGTNIEGDFEVIMKAVQECHRIVHDMGAPRISSVLKIGTRTDRNDSLEAKVQSVEKKMKGDEK